MSDKTKILWHSNTPWAATGYGAQTAIFAPLLAEHYETQISAFYGLEGNKLSLGDKLTVLPGLGQQFGDGYIQNHAKACFGELDAGIVFTLMDVWVLNHDIWKAMNVVSWVPIDHEPAPPRVKAFFAGTGAVPIAMTRFGQRELAEFDPLYCPHGIDTEVFKPSDRNEARKLLGLSEDAFVVGVVAANKGNAPSRKSFPEILQAFKVFREQHDNAVLYLHTEVTGKENGIQLLPLIKALGLPRESILFPDQYRYLFNPIPPELMAKVYASMDVFLNPCRGEGFGIPIIEAQACGIPAITPEWTAMREVNGAGWRIDYDLEWSLQGSWWARPKVEDITEALELAYRLPKGPREALADAARKHALRYDFRTVFTEHMLPALEAAEERLMPTKIEARKGPSISIVTPWFEHPELAPDYHKAVDGENTHEVLVIDNGSNPPVEGETIRLDENKGYCHANNVGLERATGEAVLFLNNDIANATPGWLELIREQLKPGTLVGANLRNDLHTQVDGELQPYLDGWCVAGMKEDLEALGGWDEDYEEPAYYSDNDLSLRAQRAGMKLIEVNLPLTHLLNRTAGPPEGEVTEVTKRNREKFADKVRREPIAA